MNVKRIVLCGGLTSLLVGCAILYWRGWREESILLRQWSGSVSVTQAAAGGNASVALISEKEIHVAEALHPPPVRRWTEQELETFIMEWTGKVRAAETELLAAGKDPFKKMAGYEAVLAKMTAEDLLGLCYGIPSSEFYLYGGMNWKSSDEEIRNMLFSEAFQATNRRFPFLALQLPYNQPELRPMTEFCNTISKCASIDREAAWEVIKEKLGEKAAASYVRYVLLGAEKTDVAARLAQARAWGVLDKVANVWCADASKTHEGQDAWIAALRDTAPEDKDVRVRNFAKEVETSGGFDAVKRLIPQLAEKGTPLYDSILKEAAARDLEEEAAPKADWILSQVSPAAAGSTAETLMKQWTAADPLAASEWLDKVPRSAPWRRSAVIAFSKVIEPHDPEAAALWRKAAGG